MIEDDDIKPVPGMAELELCVLLLGKLSELRNASPLGVGRLWAIAVTDAEKLCAWIGYALTITEKAAQ